jgi:hypothetical protein
MRANVTGEHMRQLSFTGREWDAEAIASLDSNGDGTTDIGVLIVKDDGRSAATHIKDGVSNELVGWVPLPIRP